MIAFWTIAVAALCGAMCALLGTWMVLQRLSLTGDGISHAVLPGLALTFVWFGTREPVPMMIGAAIAGLATVALTKAISHVAKVREDASLGVVFTVLFAVGVVLITRYAAQVDLDPGCVLYGLVEFVALDTFPVWGVEVPRALINIVPAFVVSVLFLVLFRKELKIMAFDGALAKTLGQRPQAVYYLLMALVAIALVASFEAVGSILVIAMLVGPAATAQLLTRRIDAMYAWGLVQSLLASVLGYWSAATWNTSVAGMIAVWLGAFYMLAFLFSPMAGLFRRRAVEHEPGRLGETPGAAQAPIPEARFFGGGPAAPAALRHKD